MELISASTRVPKPYSERELLLSLYQLAIMTVLLPPFLGGSAMVLAGFYPFPEFYSIFFDFPALFLGLVLALALWAVPRLHRRLIDIADQSRSGSPKDAVRALRRGAGWLIAGVTAYTLVGVLSADLSLKRNGYADFQPFDHMLSQLGLVPVVLLCAFPILTFYFDRLSLFLAPREVGLGAFPISMRLFLLGILSPLLVDLMLLAYFYNEYGQLHLRTLLFWLVLMLFSGIGTWLVWRSFKQSLYPLQEFIARTDADDDEPFRPIVPLSVDDLGQISQRLNRTEADRHMTVSALRETEAQMRHAEKLARIGRYRAEITGKLYWSDETRSIVGISPDDTELTTDFARTFIHPDDREGLEAAIADGMGKGFFAHRHRLTRPDGREITVLSRADVDLDDDGKPIAYVGIIQDITEAVELELQLAQSQKMEAIGNLTGGVAHDFNNLLAVILGNLELMRDTKDPAQIDKFLTSATDAAHRGAELTRKMLSFARKSRLEPSVVDLNQLVRETKNWSGRVLPANIGVETSLLAGLWQVETDPNLAQSALLNLILNARDAMAQGGKLTIETANVRIDEDYVDSRGEDIAPGRYVMLAVTDTGEGISREKLAKIFEPFFTTKAPGSGSGLGLSMIQGFMKQSGGTVRVYSEPGVGTTFKLYFPALTGEIVENQSDQPGPSPVATSAARLLVVEDETAVLEVLTETLTRAGYEVATAPSGDAALALWQTDDRFDLLVTDIVMPGQLQGTHLAHALRDLRADLPVVFMSGYASEATVHGNGLRPEDIRLMKPVSRADLIAAVEKALARRTEDPGHKLT